MSASPPRKRRMYNFSSLANDLADLRRDRRLRITRAEQTRTSLHKSLDGLLDRAMSELARGRLTALDVSALEARANRIKAA